jgi:hypothetical protein
VGHNRYSFYGVVEARTVDEQYTVGY